MPLRKFSKRGHRHHRWDETSWSAFAKDYRGLVTIDLRPPLGLEHEGDRLT
jgi:hypothetical protein